MYQTTNKRARIDDDNNLDTDTDNNLDTDDNHNFIVLCNILKHHNFVVSETLMTSLFPPGKPFEHNQDGKRADYATCSKLVPMNVSYTYSQQYQTGYRDSIEQ